MQPDRLDSLSARDLIVAVVALVALVALSGAMLFGAGWLGHLVFDLLSKGWEAF